MTADATHNPQTFEKLSELRKGTDLTWINDPDLIVAATQALPSQISSDNGELVFLADDLTAFGNADTLACSSPDGLFRIYRLLFVGTESFVVDFLISSDSGGHADSDPEPSQNDLALWLEERDAIIGNSIPYDEKFLTGLQELRASMKCDIFGVDCLRLPDGRLAVCCLGPAILRLPFSKYQGLPAWRPASALSRLIHRRATGLS